MFAIFAAFIVPFVIVCAPFVAALLVYAVRAVRNPAANRIDLDASYANRQSNTTTSTH